MEQAKSFAWAVTCVTFVVLGFALIARAADPPDISDLLFWVILLSLSEALPVSLGFGAEVTMGFPIFLAVAILFPPPFAMLIAGLGAFDVRELRREIELWRLLYNRTQVALATGAASVLIHTFAGSNPFHFPSGVAVIGGGAAVFVATNLGIVSVFASRAQRIPVAQSVRSMVPEPALGFWLSQIVLAGLGAATAAAYLRIGGFVAAFILPLLFARLSIVGARAQQQLSEKVQKQQEALLEATETVFRERESERHRIAEHIHDSSLQLLAAATYGCENASELINANRVEEAKATINSTREALDDAIRILRSSLVDLRKAGVEEGGLMKTITKYVDQIQTLWGVRIEVEGTVRSEPPVSVALGAFQILQEGVNNALKHAASDLITVRINDDDGRMHVVVEDRGTGFDTSATVSEDHVGMKLMRDRAEQLGGRLNVESERGRGTRLEAILPGGVRQ